MAWQLLAGAAAMLAAAGAIVPPAAPAQPGQQPADDPTETEILALESDRYRRLTVPVTIGSQGPFQFMIDTGAQATVLSRDLADRLELFDRQSATLVGMASRKSVETTTVPNFGLGNRRFYIQTAPLIEGTYIGGADGILGVDSLQNQRVLIDFEKQRLSDADAEELGGNRGYEIIVKARRRLGQLIITQARLDGVRVAVIVDTGAQGSVGNPALMARLRNARGLGEVEMTDVNGQELSGPVKMAGELVVGRASVRNFPILFADSPPFRSLGLSEEPAMILGMAELKLFRRVAIDFKTQRILFDMPRGAMGFDSIIGRNIGI